MKSSSLSNHTAEKMCVGKDYKNKNLVRVEDQHYWVNCQHNVEERKEGSRGKMKNLGNADSKHLRLFLEPASQTNT